MQQDRLNTRFNFGSAEPSKVVQFSVGINMALLLARTHMKSLLPQTMLKDLAPVFDVANRELASTGWKDWHTRTAVVPSTLALLPPKIDAKVLSDVQHAIARKCCLTGRYRSKGIAVSKEMTIHPLGLLVRGSIQYLVCTLFGYEDVRQLAVHRLSGTKVMSELSKEPTGFDFGIYAADASKFNSRGSIRLVVRFDDAAAEHLKETPLTRDQTVVQLKDGRTELTATVADDEQLRWWLRAFGSQVEVSKPRALRHEFESELRQSLKLYDNRE
jgi:predicted DNA-binding transcriptional regulator YafY